MLSEFFFLKFKVQRASNLDEGPKKLLRKPKGHYSSCKMKSNGLGELKSGLKKSREYSFCDQKCSQNVFPKLGCKGPLYLIKVRKNLLRNPACRYSKYNEMRTTGPRDLKMGLKWSLDYPVCDERCSKIFFPKLGCKGHFSFYRTLSDGILGFRGICFAHFRNSRPLAP